MSILESVACASKKNHSKINLKKECFFCCATLRHALRRQGPLFLVERQSIEVTVKLLTGKNFPLEICVSKTIADVKKKIQNCQGLAAEGQRLIFAGKQLSDEAKVSDCKLEAGNTIHLVMRQAARWWFQIFFIFTPIWGNDPI